MFNFKCLVGGATLVLATSALAGGPDLAPAPVPAPQSGFYINALGGADLLTYSEPFSTSGYNAGAAFGYRWDNIRVELEGNYAEHNVRNNYRNPNFFTVNGGGIASFSTLEFLRIFANAYYEFDYGNRWVPYLGAGIGWAQLSTSMTIIDNPNANFNRKWSLDHSSVTAQAILGLDFRVSDNVSVGLSYNGILASTPDYNRLIDHSIIHHGVFRNLHDAWDNQINLQLKFFF